MTDRLTELLAQKAALEAEGCGTGPELQGRIWWLEHPGNADYPHIEAGMQVFEQSDWVQEFLRGLEAEARRSLGVE